MRHLWLAPCCSLVKAFVAQKEGVILAAIGACFATILVSVCVRACVRVCVCVVITLMKHCTVCTSTVR